MFMSFGAFLVESYVIDQSAVFNALQVQRFNPRRIGRLLCEQGSLSQDQLNWQLLRYQMSRSSENGVPIEELGAVFRERVASGQIALDVAQWAEVKGWLAFGQSAQELVFLAPWFRDEYVEEAEKKWGLKIRLIVLSPWGIEQVRHLAGLSKTGREDGTGGVELFTDRASFTPASAVCVGIGSL